ncbi:uncharacterized protein LOC129987679 [Argiope bruennichi]|uniref:uncharacterized protein LOC129956698 n=1 Tax=Argiope bruennichi TaxID=94029 RepID=UPI0024947650|nr:uncharacterized protein LOC129956698 [Argiope bruennichi]XP_055951608.1 uncharacterized protein LOC129987679 [Argiope bruennichi]
MAPPKKGPFSGQRIPQPFNIDNHFDRFYIVKRVSEKDETFQTVSPFLVQKAINATIGEPTSIRKMRSGDLLIEINSRKQAQQLQKIKALATIPVRVTPHQSLNTSKGVITCGEILNLPVDLITKELKSQGVIHVRRITIRRDGETIETKHHILTFMSPKLPESIYVGYIKRPVRPYIPNPLRCFKCQRFGHSKANCRGTVTCARCSERGHESQECSAQEKCVNCKGDHTSFSRSCPRWQLEKEITAVKIKEELSYPEARKKVLSQTPSPGISYASVVRKNFCENCACQNCTKNKNTLPSSKPSSDSDTDKSFVNEHDTKKSETSKRKQSKSDKSLKLKLAKRGVSKTNLSAKLKKSATKNSVALGLASQGIAHKDLTSIFGGIPNCPDLKLHPSGDESEFEMSCEVSATPVVAPNNSSATHIS